MDWFLEVPIMLIGRPSLSLGISTDNKIFYRNANNGTGNNNTFYSPFSIVANDIYNVEMNKNNIKINSNLYTYNFPLIEATQNYSAYLFARHQPESPNNTYSIMIGKIYMCKIYENENIKRNFIPCYRKSDNKPGLYDTVNKQFYINQGTGEDFIPGPEV